jgi:isoquinoline 1-oxidoreductase
VELTPPARWSVAGRSVPRAGGADLVTGAHHYTSDVTRPGMLYGKVLRPASIGATLSGLDTSVADAMDGVVVTRDGPFVGVAAESTHAAEHALGSIQAMWKPAPGPRPSSKTIYDYLRRTRAASRGEREGGGNRDAFSRGDPKAALAAVAHRVERTFTVAYIAHTPLEPRAAVAEWSKGEDGPRLTVWTGTQRPFAVREELAHAFGMPVPHVRVLVPDTGSGYGGKHTGECAVETARLARAAGKPVKLVWTREEEFRWAYFRPAGVIDVRAGAGADGTITAWTFDNYNSGAAAIRPMYDIAHQRIEFHPSDSPLRQGSYRGLAATANHFAREMAVDELARQVGQDPLAFRLQNLSDPRLKAVFQAAADRFGWGRKPPEGHGVGIAGGFEKGGYVATCAEVAADRDSGEVRIVRAVNAFDCGAIVNPDLLRNQVEGGLIQGIGGALFEAIDFRDGVITNAHLADYRVPRFSDIPEIEIVLIDRKDQPSYGAGETPLMGIAPAVGAAIFEATGVRPTSLPMARGGLGGSS